MYIYNIYYTYKYKEHIFIYIFKNMPTYMYMAHHSLLPLNLFDLSVDSA